MVVAVVLGIVMVGDVGRGEAGGHGDLVRGVRKVVAAHHRAHADPHRVQPAGGRVGHVGHAVNHVQGGTGLLPVVGLLPGGGDGYPVQLGAGVLVEDAQGAVGGEHQGLTAGAAAQ